MENPTSDSMGLRDSGLKREKGNDTAKIPEDSPTGKLEYNVTTLHNNLTSKLGCNVKTLIPQADHPTAAFNERKHRYPTAMEDEYNKGNQYAKHPPGYKTNAQNADPTTRCPRAPNNYRDSLIKN